MVLPDNCVIGYAFAGDVSKVCNLIMHWFNERFEAFIEVFTTLLQIYGKVCCVFVYCCHDVYVCHLPVCAVHCAYCLDVVFLVPSTKCLVACTIQYQCCEISRTIGSALLIE